MIRTRIMNIDVPYRSTCNIVIYQDNFTRWEDYRSGLSPVTLYQHMLSVGIVIRVRILTLSKASLGRVTGSNTKIIALLQEA